MNRRLWDREEQSISLGDPSLFALQPQGFQPKRCSSHPMTPNNWGKPKLKGKQLCNPFWERCIFPSISLEPYSRTPRWLSSEVLTSPRKAAPAEAHGEPGSAGREEPGMSPWPRHKTHSQGGQTSPLNRDERPTPLVCTKPCHPPTASPSHLRGLWCISDSSREQSKPGSATPHLITSISAAGKQGWGTTEPTGRRNMNSPA